MPSPIRVRPLVAALASASALSLTAAVAWAEPAPPFPALLMQAQSRAPRSAEAQAQVARAEGLARQAAVLPNPTVSVEVENFSGSGPFRGTNAAESTASIGQLIELGGKRSARIGAARAEVGAARADAVRSQADFVFDLAAAYALAEASERRLQLATESLAFAQEDSRVASALVRAGKEADVRAVQARAALQAAQAALEEARSTRSKALGDLTALSGSPVAFTSIRVSLLSHAARREVAGDIDPLRSPAYQAAEAARQAAARRVQVERTRAVPDVTVSVGARRFEADKSSAMVAGVSVPFPLFDQNRGNISAARAELTAAEARLNAARLDAVAEASAAIARLNAAQARVQASEEGESAAAEASRLAGVGYEGGKLSLLELLTARRALTEARTQSIEAQIERVAAEASIARLRGAIPFGDQE
ncbi:MAG: TolC family protein [Phenylobacterium sp.]|uniref:TolC family protein n=1 Tax=Phenylobacterium sp. TaxID=1871053 RepID=UPI001A3E4CB3|nr:TolC family protein [Phenylobacterium sp.]MBL8772233.1 TolC family protein [Phenylobacterium sp.]